MLMAALAGCSAESQSQSREEAVVKASSAVKKDVYVPNPQVTDDRALVTVGETAKDRKGELTLKAYNPVNETIQVGPVTMTVKDVKVLHYVPDYSMIDFFHAFTHEEAFDFVKVNVEIQNTSDESIKFNPVAALKMNSGERKTWEDDIYLEELTGEIAADSFKKGSMGFILEKNNDYQSVDILTSDAVDESHDVVEQGKHVSVVLK
jgi:hypothetical protein